MATVFFVSCPLHHLYVRTLQIFGGQQPRFKVKASQAETHFKLYCVPTNQGMSSAFLLRYPCVSDEKILHLTKMQVNRGGNQSRNESGAAT